MRTSQEISRLFQLLRKAYEPISREVIENLFPLRVGAETPKVMFPPNKDCTFDAKVAESGFLQRNCAILTAFRGRNQDGSPRCITDNKTNNFHLKSELIESGFGVIPVDGCFREAREQTASHEDSYFIYDNDMISERVFFTKLYQLSEKYEQDSFLYKSAGMTRTAFLISTNDDARNADGDIKLAGKLYLNLPAVGPYTNLGKGRITFRVEKPSAEDLAYGDKYK